MKCRNRCGHEATGKHGYCEECLGAYWRWIARATHHAKTLISQLRYLAGMPNYQYSEVARFDESELWGNQ